MPGGDRSYTYGPEYHLAADAFDSDAGDDTTKHYPARDGLGNVTEWSVTNPG
jgi:hypothetical protein